MAQVCKLPNCYVCSVAKQYGLTRREIEVVALVGLGRSNRKIQAILQINQTTTRYHLKKLYKKTGTENKLGLLFWAKAQKMLG